MQTHRDSDFLVRLREDAERMTEEKVNTVTVGDGEENPLAAWKHGSMDVIHMPPDKHGLLRISIGSAPRQQLDLSYCTFRGRKSEAIDLLTRALAGLKKN